MGEGLLALAEAQGILVVQFDLQRRLPGLLGIYVRTPKAAGIAVDRGLRRRPRLQRCVLAHELGHHFTGAATGFWRVGYPFTATQDDSRALRWAVDLLVPTGLFLQRLGSGYSAWELAEEFQVIEAFVALKIEFLRRSNQLMGEMVDCGYCKENWL